MKKTCSGMHERLRDAVGQRSYRVLGDLTGQSVETVRRYMLGQAPSVEFVAALCGRLGINGDWMLTGSGPMHRADQRTEALRASSPSDLLAAVAGNLERLTDRVDRIERYVQTMETRLRAASGQVQPEPGSTPPARPTEHTHEQPKSRPRFAEAQSPASAGHEPAPGSGPASDREPFGADTHARAFWIAGALAERSRPNAC